MEDLSKLYKDLQHYDPHVRQNAVWGLGKYFEDEKARNNLKDEEKAKIVSQLLTLLEPKETSIEVKGRTVKMFSQIAGFLTESEIVQIFSKIVGYLTNEKAEGKDIYVTCIKTIFKEAPASSCYMIGKTIVPVLSKGIESKNIEIAQLCLNTFNDYINAFDNILIKESDSVIKNKEKIIQTAISYIVSPDITLQTYAISFIGAFSLILNKKQTSLALDKILSLFPKVSSNSERIAIFHAINKMAKESSRKQTDYLPKILSLVGQYSTKEFLEKDQSDYDEKNDMAESALNIQETYILNINGFISNIKELTAKALELIDFDPNYSYDNKEEEEVTGYDDYEYEEVAVMEDSSWKVRKAAVNVLFSIIKSGISIEKENKQKIISKLVDCLKEHDENTKYDIINCLGGYLSTLVVMDDEGGNKPLKRMSSLINDFVPTIIKQLIETLIKILNSNNLTMISTILNILPVIALVASDNIISSFNELKPAFDAACFNDNSNTIVFFRFLSNLFIGNKVYENYSSILNDIITYIGKGINHDFYKVIIEALNATSNLFPILSQELNENKNKITELYEMILPKFKTNDIDQELKTTLISTVGQMIIYCGKALDSKTLDTIFNIYLEKTANDNMRIHIFATLSKIVSESEGLELSKPISKFAKLLSSLIRKSPSHIYFQIVSLIENIYLQYPKAFKGEEKNFVTEILNENKDNSLIPVTYSMFVSMIDSFNSSIIISILNNTVNKLKTVTTSVSQIKPLYDFVEKANTKLSPKELTVFLNKYESSISTINEAESRFASILSVTCKKEDSLIKKCLSIIKNPKDDVEIKSALTLLGDICIYSKDSHNELISALENIIKSTKEELKVAISISIGKIGLCNSNYFLTQIISKPATKFSLVSLREFLSLLSEKKSQVDVGSLGKVFEWLNKKENMDKEEKGDLCGECLGRIASINQAFIKSYIQGITGDANQKATFYYGLKYIFTKSSNLSITDQQQLVFKLIEGLKEKELIVKIKAFNSLTNAAINYGDYIRTKYEELMGIFDEHHKINKEWIKEVDLGGGLRIKKDDGVEIRRGVYSTIKVFIDTFSNKINIPKTIQIASDGLYDNEEIQSIAFGCLIKIGHLFPTAFLSFIEGLCDQLKGILDKIKSADFKKEFIENIKRLFDELSKEHEIEDNPKFKNLQEEISK